MQGSIGKKCILEIYPLAFFFQHDLLAMIFQLYNVTIFTKVIQLLECAVWGLICLFSFNQCKHPRLLNNTYSISDIVHDVVNTHTHKHTHTNTHTNTHTHTHKHTHKQCLPGRQRLGRGTDMYIEECLVVY